MGHFQPPSMDNGEEPYEQLSYPSPAELPLVNATTEQQKLDFLLQRGFRWEEAVKLLRFQGILYENSEMRQRINDDPRMQFARWLYEQGEMSDGKSI
jgi:hypothetical protein